MRDSSVGVAAGIAATGVQQTREETSVAPVNPMIQAVVQGVNTILAADGGSVAVKEQRGGTLVLSYKQGSSRDCPECVLSDDSVVELIRESLALEAPFITDVQLVSEG